MEREKSKQIIVAMKGHPGTGKSGIAHSIATALNSPLLDKDDVRDSTRFLSPYLHHHLLNDLSYEVLWQIASTQLRLGLSIVIDSPLSRKSHFDWLVQLANPRSSPPGSCSSSNISSCQLERSGDEPSSRTSYPGIRLVIVECRPKDGAEWRRRVEERGASDGASWHKPATWRDIEKLLEEYDGCYEYDVGEVPKLVLDTTAEGVSVEEHVSSVLNFIHSSHGQY